jgi:hypothetical protein
MEKYLTAKRIASIKQYLADCESGIHTVTAWNAHKARMQESQSPFNPEDSSLLHAWACEPCSYQLIAKNQWRTLIEQKWAEQK